MKNINDVARMSFNLKGIQIYLNDKILTYPHSDYYMTGLEILNNIGRAESEVRKLQAVIKNMENVFSSINYENNI